MITVDRGVMTRHHLQRHAILAASVLGVLLAHTASAAAPRITDEDVELAIQRAVEFLWTSQGADGGWDEPRFETLFPEGLTALAAFSLRTAGVSPNDARFQHALERLRREPNRMRTTYGRAFRLMLWTTLDPTQHRRQITEDTRFLASRQTRQGVWGYGGHAETMVPRGFADNSNSQLAILALWESSQIGGEINPVVWQRAEEAWLACQNEDGGWGYAPADNINPLRPDSYGSMTAAGLATMYILYDQLYARAAGRFDGVRTKNCGHDHPRTRPLRQAIARAWQWMNMRFVPDHIPAIGTATQDLEAAWLTYYLYSVERAGVASGFKTFGANNWYRDLAEQLVRTQDADGSWGGVYQTCFGLLALVKGRTPVVINKLRYGTDEDWNNNPRDAATLTRWLSKTLESPVTWQIVDLRAESTDVRDAPILYLSGHRAPNLTEIETEILRDYVYSGGTIVAVACCSRRGFVDGTQKLFDNLFPRLERQVLAPEHPLWSIVYPLKPSDEIIGYSDGCRTRVFLITRGITGAWQQNLKVDYREMFELGANLLHYATNRTQPRSLAAGLPTGRIAGVDRSAPQPKDDDAFVAPEMPTVRLGRLRHGGDHWIHPYALDTFAQELLWSLNIQLRPTGEVDPATDDLSRYDLLWLTGTKEPTLDTPRVESLKRYLEAGGTLVATACCGRSGFDEGFAKLIDKMYGADALIPIPPTDPLITGRLSPPPTDDRRRVLPAWGSNLQNPRLRRLRPQGLGNLAVPTSQPAGLSLLRPEVPVLQGVRSPDGRRWIVIYSPIDIHAGIDGHFCVDCLGYEPRDARALAGNIILYIWLQK